MFAKLRAIISARQPVVRWILTLLCVSSQSLLWPMKASGFQPFMATATTPYSWNLSAHPSGKIPWMVVDGTPSMVHDAAASALQSWSDATNGTLSFVEAPGGIVIGWDPTGTKMPDPLFLAFTTFQSDSRNTMISAQIYINAANYTWHQGGDGGVGLPDANGIRDASIDSVILHELGHALGLNHSDLNPTGYVGDINVYGIPTMNSVIYPGAQTLHMDDIAGIRSLYVGAQGSESGTQLNPPLTVSASLSTAKVRAKILFSQIGGDPNTAWDFGDGSIGTGAAASHKYLAPGSYTVTARSHGSSGYVLVNVVRRLPRTLRLHSTVEQPR